MWFETLFKYPVNAYQTGRLVFSNVDDPFWWLVGGVVISIVILASVVTGIRTRGLPLWQRMMIGLLQAGVAVGVVGLLTGPMLRTSTLQPGANNIAVLLDISGSMDFANSPGEQSRSEAAVTLVQELLDPALSGIAKLVPFTFDNAAIRIESFSQETIDGKPERQAGTRLIKAIDSVLGSFNGMPLAGVVVLSDGADNEEGSKLTATGLAHYGVPVHTIGFGPRSLSGEAQLSDVQLPADAPPGSQVTARLKIEHSSSGAAILRVRDGMTLLAMEKITLNASSPITRTQITFDSGATGIRELSFELEPPPGDSFLLNNKIHRLLTVNERQRRILYLEGEPRWEYKFIRRAVAADEVINLVSWLRTTDNKTYRQGISNKDELVEGFPLDLTALYSYDVIILGSLAATSLTEEQHEWLESFVSKRGGSLLALAGRQALADGGWDVKPLASALPVILNRRQTSAYGPMQGRARPTRDGLISPLTQFAFPGGKGEGAGAWVTLPPLGDYQPLGELKPAASVLLELVHDDGVSPLLVSQPYGLGTTAVLATATTWRWQMRTPPDDPRHGLFWRQLLRHLAESAQRARNVALTVEGDGIVIRVKVMNKIFEPSETASVKATIIHFDGSQESINLVATGVPGVLAARYVPAQPGIYQVDVQIHDFDEGIKRIEKITRFVRTGVDNREYFNPLQNEALLRRIADATGGQYWQPGQAGKIAAALTYSGTGVQQTEFFSLWNLPVFFALLLMMKFSEWGLRRIWGRI